MFAKLLNRRNSPAGRGLESLTAEFVLQAQPYGLDEAEKTTLLKLQRWRKGKYNSENDPLRVTHFCRLLKYVDSLSPGDYIEMGTQHGGTAKIIWDLMPASSHLYCCDTFTGFDQADLDVESTIAQHGFTVDSIGDFPPDAVERIVTEDRPSDAHLHFVVGRVPLSLEKIPTDARFRFMHLDMDLYEPTRTALHWSWERLVPGAVLLFHDYDALPPVRKAIDEFLNPFGIVATPLSDRFGSAVAFKPLAGWQAARR